MPIDINKPPKEVIKSLTQLERDLLYECSVMKISVKKNFNKHTLKKKMTDTDSKDFEVAFNNLIKAGILVKYRKENYGISKKGRIIQNIIREEKRRKTYSNLNRILILDI